MGKLRHYVFVAWPNLFPEECEKLWNDPIFTYIAYGEEVCPTTGQAHWQGYCQTYAALKTLFPKFPKTDFEVARGTSHEATGYARKDGKYHEKGVLHAQGERTDWKKIATLAMSGDRKTIFEEFPSHYIRYNKAILSLPGQLTIPRDRNNPPTVIVLVGAPGTGKTRYVYDHHEASTIFRAWDTTFKWFDGYTGQPVVLFDDFRGSCCRYEYLLQLTDRYPLRTPVKGSTTEWIPQIIYFTSNVHPDNWYPWETTALKRRITEVKVFGECIDETFDN